MRLTKVASCTGGLLLAALLVAGVTGVAPADIWLDLGSPGAGVRGDQQSANQAPLVGAVDLGAAGMDVRVEVPGLSVSEQRLGDGTFCKLGWPDAAYAGETGGPAVPVVRRMFIVPHGATVSVDVSAGPPVAIDAARLGRSLPLMPMQTPKATEPRDKSHQEFSPQDGTEPTPAVEAPVDFAPAAYAVDAYTPAERATVTELGVMRGHRLWLLEMRPVAYNPVSGTVQVWSALTVRLRFGGGTATPGTVKPLDNPGGLILNPPQCGEPRAGQNLLIITAQDFAGTAPLTQFVNTKAARGFKVAVYVAAVGASQNSIRSYILGLWGTADAPDYLLIIGDALGYSHYATSYTVPMFTGGGLHTWVTDLPYACMDGAGDWYADIPFGRWPIRTVPDLQAIVDKTLYVEGGGFSDPTYAARALCMSGADVEAQGEQVQDEIIESFLRPAGVAATKLYARDGASTADVAAGFNDGCALATYIGHSGVQQWNDPAFTNAHVSSLTNANKYPLVISFSCALGAFGYIAQDPTMMEHMLREPNKAAVACYVTTVGNYYPWSCWHDMHRCMIAALYSEGMRELGVAMNSAVLRFVTLYGPTAPVSRDFAEVFELLGDPSLRLPLPPPENYLIVTPPDYLESAPLAQFINARSAKYKVNKYAVPSGTNRTAIKTYIQNLYATADRPAYILIVGDTSGDTSTSNTIPHWVGSGPRAGATDLYYGCMDAGDDWYPEIPVGRFSVSTVAQLQAIVDKTLHVEAGSFSNPDFVRRGAFLANPDTNGTAEPTHDWVINNYFEPNGYESIRIYSSQGGSTQQVTNAVNQGCLFTLYMGHSSSGGWWDPSFTQSNVNALTNTGLYGLVFGWSCNTANYPTSECFGETWIRAANKGAAAYISASNLIYWGSVENWLPSAIQEKAFFRSFFDKNIWKVGPAWRAGLYDFLEEYGQPATPGGPPTQNAGITRDFFEEFVLLGDPALQLPQPVGFRLTATPAAQEVCTGVSPSATYTLQAIRTGGFSENISFSAVGHPPGTSVSFSVNPLPAPFTNSAMLITGLDGAAPGLYTVTVTATGGSIQKTTEVTLGVAAATPGNVTLTGPSNGAVGVSRSPTLVWQAATQAVQYHLQVATSAAFSTIVYEATTANTSHVVQALLNGGISYHWRVQATNGCGGGAFSTPFSFTTIAQPDYFTQQFSGNFDLHNSTIRFIPDGSGDFYYACKLPATSLPTDPTGGTTLSLGDDSSVQIAPTTPVLLYGVSHSSLFVNANGNLTFDSGDGNWQESLADHFSQARVAALFHDLNPASGGTISWKQTTDRIAVTYLEVPKYGTSAPNTFQVELFFNGEIHITWLTINLTNCICGLSPGGGLPADFVASDLSAYLVCGGGPPTGACCLGETCDMLTEGQCQTQGGDFRGEGTPCTPNPCATYQPQCVIISEVVNGNESGGCPRWIEITNTGELDFAFFEGGLIVQMDGSSDLEIDVDLTGVVISAGQSFVINTNQLGACTNAYNFIYGQPPELVTNAAFGDGNDRYILTNNSDGSSILDIYGEFGVSGTGRPWEYTNGYAYRLPNYLSGRGTNFVAGEWYFGGVNSLSGTDPTALLLQYTNPRVHSFNGTCGGNVPWGDLNCDAAVDLGDVAPFVLGLLDPDAYAAQYPACNLLYGDLNNDATLDGRDIQLFVNLLIGG